MRDTLIVGDEFVFEYTVSNNKTVPNLYPESTEYRAMPEIFATGFMVGLLEWCCIEALRPHLQDGEGSLGTYILTTHCAPTPPGMRVTVKAVCKEILHGNNVFWFVEAHDECDLIAEGIHGRHVINTARFLQKVAKKASLIGRENVA